MITDRKAIIDPCFDAFYYSFYIEGVRRYFPGKAIVFRNLCEKSTPPNTLRLLLPCRRPVRVCIDAYDTAECDLAALEWSDIYAKVNINQAKPPALHPQKLFAIGPSFPVRVWNAPATCLAALVTYVRAGQRLFSTREHFANFYRPLRYRLPEMEYSPSSAEKGFLFFLGSIWKREREVNEARAAFIRACGSLPQYRFEGGFTPRTKRDVPGYENLTVPRRYHLRAYLGCVRRSMVVFNTPGVMGCFGWKLGEFLALGKAIISTPLSRLLPSPLEHGQHIHVVNHSEELPGAIVRLMEDDEYRTRLERNARNYYLRFLAPERVIERILQAVP